MSTIICGAIRNEQDNSNLEALEDSRMFGIRRNHVHAVLLKKRQYCGPPGNKSFLVCERDGFLLLDGLDGWKKPSAANDALNKTSDLGIEGSKRGELHRNRYQLGWLSLVFFPCSV